ncbi:MAG: GerMN domain-containing protein [Xenococcus sp. MO_188.B8]|nr:GerMN domain-containing protein [Xenococcus sp. MO_188.B8]
MSSSSNPSPSPNNKGCWDKVIKLLIALGGGATIVSLLVFALNRCQKPQQLTSSTQAPTVSTIPDTSNNPTNPAPDTSTNPTNPAPDTSTTPTPPTPDTSTNPTNPAPDTSNTPTPEPTQVEVYYIASSPSSAELKAQKVSVKNEVPNKILQSAFEHLLEGSSNESLKSTIPQGTKLYSINSQGDEVYVDLSQEFASGGGSESMTCRLGQVIYTATSLNNQANVWIKVEGKLLSILGGEGVIVHDEDLSAPLNRKAFKEYYSCL